MNRFIRTLLVMVGSLFAVVGMNGYIATEKALLLILFLILCALAVLPEALYDA